MNVKLVWATPDLNNMVGYMARVSNPKATPEDPSAKLIRYLMDHAHWSPLEMANICLEIETTRDIARQMLRHSSFKFQEFSQRYAEVPQEVAILSEARLQDTKNRQNSLVCTDEFVSGAWHDIQNKVWDFCYFFYKAALKLGIAKELARKLLPEGLTFTKLYVNGTVRDWFHYLKVRTGPETQLEHRQLAWACAVVCDSVAPDIFLEIVGDGG